MVAVRLPADSVIAVLLPGPWSVSRKYSPAATPETVSVVGTVSTVELLIGLGLVDQVGTPNVGAVRSTLTLTVAEAALPATSVAVPVTSWFAPSVVMVWSAGQVASPESVSEQM